MPTSGSSQAKLALEVGVEVGRALVDDVGHVADDHEAVREADRQVDRAQADVVEAHRVPAPVGRRAAADVDRHVQDRARGRSGRAWPARRRREKCMPRTTPRVEREWLSCTQASTMPASASRSARKVSTKNPLPSRWTSGSMTAMPGRLVASGGHLETMVRRSPLAAHHQRPGPSGTRRHRRGRGPAGWRPASPGRRPPKPQLAHVPCRTARTSRASCPRSARGAGSRTGAVASDAASQAQETPPASWRARSRLRSRAVATGRALPPHPPACPGSRAADRGARGRRAGRAGRASSASPGPSRPRGSSGAPAPGTPGSRCARMRAASTWSSPPRCAGSCRRTPPRAGPPCGSCRSAPRRTPPAPGPRRHRGTRP